MTSTEYIIQKMRELVTNFPVVRCRYEHHVLSDTHFVEVVPNSIYKLNTDYLKWEEEITFSFPQLFPAESLCFISDDALIGIRNIEFELKGQLFDVIKRPAKAGLPVAEPKQRPNAGAGIG